MTAIQVAWERVVHLGSIVLLTASLVSPALAQSTKLSGPLANPGSDVVEFAVDPDGTHAFYVADQDALGVRELYRVPIDGSSAPQKLNAALPASGDVTGVNPNQPSFLIGSAGWVVYRADPDVDETFEIFGVPSDGSAPPVRLNEPPVAGGDVLGYSISSDGTRVVYQADQESDDVTELFAVPIDGSAPPLRLHPPFTQEAALEYGIDPSGTFVVYARLRYSPQFQEIFEVFSVPSDASGPPALLGSYSCFCSISHWVDGIVFSPDGAWVSYRRERDNGVDVHRDLFLAPADGSAPAIELPTSQYCSSGEFTADSARVLYGVGHDFSFSSAAPQLYSTTLGGVVTHLDAGEGGNQGAWQLDPLAGTVYFGQPSGVYRVPADGSASQTLLSQSMPAPDFQPVLHVSPDGNRVVWVSEDANDLKRIQSVPSAGGPTVTLTPAPSADVSLALRITPDSRAVVYLQQTAPAVHQLFVVGINGTRAARPVNDPLPPGGTVLVPFNLAFLQLAFLADGSLAYLASEDTSGVFELYKASLELRRPLLRAPAPAGPVSR